MKALREVSHATKAQEDAAILRLRDLSPDPNALDYLSAKEYDDLTPRQIAERMLAYRPSCCNETRWRGPARSTKPVQPRSAT